MSELKVDGLCLASQWQLRGRTAREVWMNHVRPPRSPAAAASSLVAEGRSALRRGDAATARAIFERAPTEPASGDVIEGLARASYLERDYLRAIEEWERAYAAHRDAGDLLGTVRVARTLAYTYGAILGDAAVMSGWLARTTTLLGDGESARRRVGGAPAWDVRG